MKINNDKIVLIVTTVGSFLPAFIASAINIALPSISNELSMNAIETGWIATAYLLAAAIFSMPFGKIADIYGRKKVYVFGIGIFSFASLLTTLLHNFTLFIIVRLIHGLSAAMIFSTGIAIVISSFHPSQRGKVLGINVGAVYLGLSLGPVIGGILTKFIGWRSIFYLSTILGIITLVLTLLKIDREWKDAKNERFDIFGSVIYGISLACVMFGVSRLPGLIPTCIAAIGVIGIIIFFRYESSIQFPIMRTDLFLKNRVFAFSNVSAFINYSSTFAVGFLLSLYLQVIKKFDPQEAGLILIIQPVVMTFLSPVIGKLSDRIEPRYFASTGMAITVIGLFLLYFLTSGTPIWIVLVSLLIIGIGLALFSSPNTNAIMGSVEKNEYGVASASVSTMRLVGQVFSMGISMLFFSIIMGQNHYFLSNKEGFLKSIHFTFLLFAVLSAVGILLSSSRGNIHKK